MKVAAQHIRAVVSVLQDQFWNGVSFRDSLSWFHPLPACKGVKSFSLPVVRMKPKKEKCVCVVFFFCVCLSDQLDCVWTAGVWRNWWREILTTSSSCYRTYWGKQRRSERDIIFRVVWLNMRNISQFHFSFFLLQVLQQCQYELVVPLTLLFSSTLLKVSDSCFFLVLHCCCASLSRFLLFRLRTWLQTAACCRRPTCCSAAFWPGRNRAAPPANVCWMSSSRSSERQVTSRKNPKLENTTC